jgi:hypothetical protein
MWELHMREALARMRESHIKLPPGQMWEPLIKAAMVAIRKAQMLVTVRSGLLFREDDGDERSCNGYNSFSIPSGEFLLWN